jgi:hypothetical protein
MPQVAVDHSQLKSQLLTSEGRVAGNTVDQSGKDGADTDTSTSETNGGSTSAVDLGSSDDGSGSRLDDDTAGLHDSTHHVGGDVVAGAIEEQAVADSGLLAYRADDGAWDGSYVEADCVNKNASSSFTKQGDRRGRHLLHTLRGRHRTRQLLHAHAGDGSSHLA